MNTKENAVREATTMFVRYGIKSVRMDDVAEKLGISKRTLYEIFGDKESLLTECVRFYMAEIERRKNEKLSQICNIIEEVFVMMDSWDTEAEMTYNLMASVRKFYPKIYACVAEEEAEKGYAELKTKLEKSIEDGFLLGSINYDLAISILSYSIYGIFSNRDLKLPSNVSEVEAFKYVVTYFLRGIATEKGIRMIDEFVEKRREQQ